MARPIWRHDWAGFSGGWYPTGRSRWQLTILGIHHFGYFLDVMAPLIGDVRLGFHTRGGMNANHRAWRHEEPHRVVIERRPGPA